ncbi:hypothetical protein F2P81_016620 [Scophthalmus maximus]|uniref:Uncharacterized protein n=1 Tax=Scophthalmus maximus TaxID=52904 RepID=A0A6A4SHI8_SCOMX|nr:hypothetical protein F2P81_016620 [Scophthalmus maximus]
MSRMSQNVVVGETPSVRRTAENDLDVQMRTILNEAGQDPYEKMKKYNALLQRFLALNRQGDELRVSPEGGSGGGGGGGGGASTHRVDNVEEDKGEQDEMRKAADETLQDVLLNLPQRNHKNVRYIMNKLSKSENG